MIRLTDALSAWGALPLQAGLTTSSYVVERNRFTAMAIATQAHAGKMEARVGVFLAASSAPAPAPTIRRP